MRINGCAENNSTNFEVQKMNVITKKIMLSVMGVLMALGSSLSTMEGGAAITVSQIGDIPVIAWAFAIGAGISGYLGVSAKNNG